MIMVQFRPCHGSGGYDRALTAEAGSVHVVFVADKVAVGQVSLRVLLFSPVNIIPP
jgi:hypothetical protein